MYKELKELIDSSKKIVLVSHTTPDADAIGSSLAFYLALKRMGKNVKIFNATKEISNRYDFLPSFNKISHIFPQSVDLVISFDSGSFKRLGIEKANYKIANIDHHKSNEMYGDINIVEPNYASTSLVVFDILKSWDIVIGKDIALCIYMALVEDTNFFTDDTTNERVFNCAYELVKLGANPEVVGYNLTKRNSLAKLRLDALFINNIKLINRAKIAIGEVDEEMLKKSGALRYDTSDLADMLTSLATVEFAIFILDMGDGKIKFSLRSFKINVADIASSFGGGGHKSAAGFMANAHDKEKIINKIVGDLDI